MAKYINSIATEDSSYDRTAEALSYDFGKASVPSELILQPLEEDPVAAVHSSRSFYRRRVMAKVKQDAARSLDEHMDKLLANRNAGKITPLNEDTPRKAKSAKGGRKKKDTWVTDSPMPAPVVPPTPSRSQPSGSMQSVVASHEPESPPLRNVKRLKRAAQPVIAANEEDDDDEGDDIPDEILSNVPFEHVSQAQPPLSPSAIDQYAADARAAEKQAAEKAKNMLANSQPVPYAGTARREFNLNKAVFVADVSLDALRAQSEVEAKKKPIPCGRCGQDMFSTTSAEGNPFIMCNRGTCNLGWVKYSEAGAFHTLIRQKLLPRYRYPNPPVRCYQHHIECQLIWTKNTVNRELHNQLWFICGAKKDDGFKKCGFILNAVVEDEDVAHELAKAHYDEKAQKVKDGAETRERSQYLMMVAEDDIKTGTGAYAYRTPKERKMLEKLRDKGFNPY